MSNDLFDVVMQKKLTDRIFEVMKEFKLYPSHIQCNLNQEDHSAKFVMIFFSGVRFDKSDFQKCDVLNEEE